MPLPRVLLACIKFLGACPCPTCLVSKEDIRNLGTKRDICNHERKVHTDNQVNKLMIERVRKWMYEQGQGINPDPSACVPTAPDHSGRRTLAPSTLSRANHRALWPNAVHTTAFVALFQLEPTARGSLVRSPRTCALIGLLGSLNHSQLALPRSATCCEDSPQTAASFWTSHAPCCRQHDARCHATHAPLHRPECALL